MSKLIFTADIHLQPFSNDTIELENGIRLKLQELLNSIRQLLDYAVKNEIETVIFGGDIGHHRSTIHTRPFYLFISLLMEYKDKITYKFIPGNHDGHPQFLGENCVSLLSGYENIDVFMEPTVEGNITYIPDGTDMYNDIKNAKGTDILVSHFPLSEAATDSGLKVTTKFSKKDLKKFKLVLIGDYHTHQTIDGFIHYPGTLIPMNKGEKGAKGFIVFDDETLETEFVEVTGFRKYVEIEITEETSAKELKSIIKESTESNDFLTVRNTLQSIPTSLKSVVKDVTVIDDYEPEEIMRGISSAMQIGEQMKKFLEIEGINEDEREKYLQIGLTALGCA